MDNTNLSSGKSEYHFDNYRILEFIENLNEQELVALWRIVNSPEYLCLIADEINKMISDELDESGIL